MYGMRSSAADNSGPDTGVRRPYVGPASTPLPPRVAKDAAPAPVVAIESYEGVFVRDPDHGPEAPLVFSLGVGGRHVSVSYPSLSQGDLLALRGHRVMIEANACYLHSQETPDHLEVFRHEVLVTSAMAQSWKGAFQGLAASDWDVSDR